jgi:hypothetical protein
LNTSLRHGHRRFTVRLLFLGGISLIQSRRVLR